MPTKLDQLKKMKELKNYVVSKKGSERRTVLLGTKEIARIERKLKKVKVYAKWT